MLVTWTDHDRKCWDELHLTAGGALQQDWAAGEALKGLGSRILRAKLSDERGVLALAQFTVRRFGVLTVALCTRGPVWTRALSGAEKAAAYRALKRAAPAPWPRLMLFTPDETCAENIGVDRLCRAMTGYATAVLDLTQDEDALRRAQKPKWRNRLVSSEKAGLSVVRGGAKPSAYRWLVEQESAQRERRGYRSLPPGFVEAFQAAKPKAANSVLTLRADIGRQACAAMLFLVHGQAATYHLGWSNEEGRRHGAHNLLLWRAMCALKGDGVRSLDLGGLDTGAGAGLARFKIGAGGAVATLPGTYF